MIIRKDTEMLLFRFNNYKNHAFIHEHLSVMNENGYVWMLKLGRHSNTSKLQIIKDCGGWIILRSPKADGSKYYIAHFSEVIEDPPIDSVYPLYYKKLLDGADEDSVFSNMSQQWFRLESIFALENEMESSLVISQTGKNVEEVIKTTRTAVMFVRNDFPIEVREVEN